LSLDNLFYFFCRAFACSEQNIEVDEDAAKTHTSHIKRAYFFVYTHHGHHLEEIHFNENYWLTLLENLQFCWDNFLAEKLLMMHHIVEKEPPVNLTVEQAEKNQTVTVKI